MAMFYTFCYQFRSIQPSLYRGRHYPPSETHFSGKTGRKKDSYMVDS